MKSRFMFLLFILLLCSLAAMEVREIPFADVEAIALRNATEFWGQVYADEPIPLYDRNGKLLAWQFNFSKGKPFPQKGALIERIKSEGSNLFETKWATEEFACMTLGARTDKPVLIGYADGLSYEYCYSTEIDRVAKTKLSANYVTKSQIFVSMGSRWSVVSDGKSEYYVKAFPPSQILDKKAFWDATQFSEHPPKQNDYTPEWDTALGGQTYDRVIRYIPYPELMPSIRWSYGCSPTAGATVAAYWDNTSPNRTGDYSTLVGVYRKRFDPVTEELCYHVPDALPNIADFMDTDSEGSTMPWNVNDGMEDFLVWKGHTDSWCYNNDYIVDYFGSIQAMFGDLMEEINWGNPTIMNVWGHSVTGYGYNTSGSMVAIHNSNSPAIDNWHIDEFWQLVQVHPRPRNGCAIKLIHPDGGQGWIENGDGYETYYAGSIMDISWISDNVPNTTVEIFITPVSTMDVDDQWHEIVSNAPNTGSYSWQIPSNWEGDDYRVAIQVLDSQGYILGAAGSYGSFTILPGGSNPDLQHDVSTTMTMSPTYYNLALQHSAWTVAGLRIPFDPNSSNNSQSTLTMFTPDFNNHLASSSAYNRVNWIAVDKTHVDWNFLGLKAEIAPFNGTNSIEWEGGLHTLTIGNTTGLQWGSGDVAKMWNIQLSPGTYRFALSNSANADFGIGLCSSYGGNNYITPASMIAVSDRYGNTTGESFIVTVTQTDVYGFIAWANLAYIGTISIRVSDPGYWTGSADTNWANPLNWATGVVPDADANVVIPYGTPNYPTINAGTTAACENLLLSAGATLKLSGSIYVSGTATISGYLRFDSTNPVMVVNDIIWTATSTSQEYGEAIIYVSGDWIVNDGATVELNYVSVEFTGNTASRIQINSTTNAFKHLNVNKTNSAGVLIDEETTKIIVIRGNLTINAGAVLRNTCEYSVKLMGNLSSSGVFIFESCLLLMYSRLQNQSISLSGANRLYSLEIDTNEAVSLNSDLTLYGTMFITNGVLNAGSRTITVYGSWFNDGGTLSGSNHRVIFSGSNNEDCYETSFKNLELNKINGSELAVATGKSMICQSYDWTAGSIRVRSGAQFIANDLADSRIRGRFYLEGGLIELHQDVNQWVDLDADLYIYSGTFNIYGGTNYPSEWAYTRTITVRMEGGVLDFKNNGVYLSSTGYFLNDFISGGIIRTSGDFIVERPGFNPTGGTIEMYGTGSANLQVNMPSTIYSLTIDKSSRDGDESGRQERTNMVKVIANTKVVGICEVNSGILEINNCRLTVEGYLSVSGGLKMDAPTDILETHGSFSWHPGSSAVSLSGGLMVLYNNLFLYEDCNVQMPAAVTIQMAGGYTILNNEPAAQLGTLILEATSTVCYFYGTEAVNLNGDLLIKPNVTLRISNGNILHVSGKIDIWNQGTLLMKGPCYVTTTNLYNSGQLILDSDCLGELAVSNTFLQYSNGSLALHGGSLILNAGYNGSHYAFGGTTSMSAGTLQITNNGMQIGTSGFNFSGGTIKVGWGFKATNAGTFQPNSGTVEFIGESQANIDLASNNYLPNLVVNKTGASGAVYLSANTRAKLNCTINSGKLYVNHRKLTVDKSITINSSGYLYGNNSDDEIWIGQTWTNSGGPDNFIEGTGMVGFLASTYTKDIYTSENFYNLVADTQNITRPVDINGGMTVNVANNLTINSGALRTNPMSHLNVGGNVVVNNSTFACLGNNASESIINIQGDLTLTNSIVNTYYANMLLNGNLVTDTSSSFYLMNTEFVNDVAAGRQWQNLNCYWKLDTESVVEFTNLGLQLLSSATLDQSGTYKTGDGLYAVQGNAMSAFNGTIEFIGSSQSIITLGGDNTLPSVKINKTNAAVALASNVKIRNNFTITSGVFNSNNYAIEINGDWYNHVGTAGYTCGTSVITFKSTNSSWTFPSQIWGDQTFYKLIINNQSNSRVTSLAHFSFDILTDIQVLSGGLLMEYEVEIANDLIISEGAFVEVYWKLYLGRNLVDNNSSLVYTDDLKAGFLDNINLGQLILNGTGNQTFTVGYDALIVTYLIMQKTSGSFLPSKPVHATHVNITSGTWGRATEGLTHSTSSLVIGSSGIWSDNTGTLRFMGETNGNVQILGTANFKNILVEKQPTGPDTGIVSLVTNLALTTAGTVTVNGGVLNLQGYELQTNGNVAINSGAKLHIGEGGTLKMASDTAINVNSGGELSLLGNVTQKAKITRTGFGNYALNILSGATISARYAIFENMNLDGVNVHNGATVSATYPFDYCTFQQCQNGGTLLRIDNDQMLTINGAYFPTTIGPLKNASKSVNHGTVSFINETGGFAGTINEHDPYFRINWSADVPQIQVNPGTLSFGTVPWSTISTSRPIRIDNPGSAMLSGTITMPPNFFISPQGRIEGEVFGSASLEKQNPILTRNVLDFQVGIGGTAFYDVFFQPSEPIYYSETAVITHNAANSPFYLYLNGQGSGARIDLDHSFYNIDLQPSEIAHRTLNISNTGSDSLSYSGWIYYPRDSRDNLLYTGFEDGCPPPDWSQIDVVGESGNWSASTVNNYPYGANVTPYAGTYMASFNSYSASNGHCTRLQSPSLSLSNKYGLSLSFWMYHEPNYPSYPDTMKVQVSVAGGAWTNVGYPIARYSMTAGWQEHIINLSAYDYSTSLQIGFLAKSGWGNNMLIDEVRLTGTTQLPTNWVKLNDSSSIWGYLGAGAPPLPIDISVDATNLPSGWYYPQVRFMTNDPSSPEKIVWLIVRVGSPDYNLNPTSLTFGNVEVGESSTLEFDIVNTGQIGLTGTVTAPDGYNVELLSGIRNGESSTLASLSSKNPNRNAVDFYVYPGIVATFAVEFAPSQAAGYNSQLTISSNTGTDRYLPLYGSGINLPQIITSDPTDIAIQSATVGGNILSSGNLPILERGICYNTWGDPHLDGLTVVAEGSTNPFTIPLGNLQHMRLYYVRAYATNALGTSYGEEKTFTTLTPSLVTNLSVLPDFGLVPVGTASQPQSFTISGTNLVDMVMMSSAGSFQISESPDSGYSDMVILYPENYLLPETEIYVRFTPSETGLVEQIIVPLTVGGGACDVAISGTGVTTPEVETATIVNISQTGAEINARIISDGLAPVSACGVCYGTSSEPTIAGLHTSEGTQTGWFLSSISNLEPNTQYFVRSYAQNVAGLVYGNELSFYTVPNPAIDVVTDFLNPFGSIVVGQVSAIDTLMVSAQQLMDNLVISVPSGFGISLTPDGRDFESQLSLTPVTGNIDSTPLYIRFAPTTAGNLSNYLVCESPGIPDHTTMLNGIGVTLPSLVTLQASEVTFNSAMTGGELIHNGWGMISASGICYSTHENPDLSDPHTATLITVGEFYTALENLDDDTTYYYRAYATNMAGTAYGEQLSFRTALGYLNPPQNLRISKSESGIGVQWDAVDNANSYLVYRSANPYAENWGLPCAITADTFWTDAEPFAKYFYRVVASSEPVE